MKKFITLCLLVAGCSGLPGAVPNPGPKIPIKFKAALLRKNGDQIKVARTKFTADPWGPGPGPGTPGFKDDGRRPVEFTTDLEGAAEFQLEVGRWYVIGSFDAGASGKAFWTDVPVDITASTKTIELSNDNATGISFE